MALLKRGNFPGLEQVLEYLPHPGEVFLDFFPVYKEVQLKARATQKSLAHGKVEVYVARGGAILSGKKAPVGELNLEELEKPIPPFKVKITHKDLLVSEVAKKERVYFQNQAQKILDQGNFSMILSGSCFTRNGFAGIIWETSFLDPDINPAKESEFFHFIIHQDPKIQGLRGPIGPAPWDFFIPEGTAHHKFLAISSRWYKNWEIVKNLAQWGVSVSLVKTWQQCCDDLNGVACP